MTLQQQLKYISMVEKCGSFSRAAQKLYVSQPSISNLVNALEEELGLPMVMERKHSDTPMCANVDMYSGLVYTMLGIPEDVFTPLFASARIAGWCANRIEEVVTCHRIMRPAYRAVVKRVHYAPIEERTARLDFNPRTPDDDTDQ